MGDGASHPGRQRLPGRPSPCMHARSRQASGSRFAAIDGQPPSATLRAGGPWPWLTVGVALCVCFQVYWCRPLALAFLELTVVRKFHELTHQPAVPPTLRAVLQRLSALYGLWALSQHTALLYRGEAPPLAPAMQQCPDSGPGGLPGGGTARADSWKTDRRRVNLFLGLSHYCPPGKTFFPYRPVTLSATDRVCLCSCPVCVQALWRLFFAVREARLRWASYPLPCGSRQPPHPRATAQCPWPLPAASRRPHTVPAVVRAS